METNQAINLPSPEDPFPLKNVSIYCAKSHFFSVFSSMGAAFLVLSTLHSENRQVRSEILDRANKPTCLESVKIPGRYQVNIMPSISMKMHGVEAVTPFSGGYRCRREASFTFEASFPGFVFVFGSLSAYRVTSHSTTSADK
jgi:hypothetical protein